MTSRTKLTLWYVGTFAAANYAASLVRARWHVSFWPGLWLVLIGVALGAAASTIDDARSRLRRHHDGHNLRRYNKL